MRNAFGIRLLALATACLYVRCEDDEICLAAHEQRGFCLSKHNYKDVQANSLMQCYMKCASEKSSCNSINFFSGAAKKCQMNTATRATRPQYFTNCPGSTYMDNIWRVKKGSTHWAPGHSCKDIRQSEDSVGDGEFWIDPAASGVPIKVYCDMTTDNGGWTLIRRVELTDGSIPDAKEQIETLDYREQLSNYKSNDRMLLAEGLLALREEMGFDQLRFYCHKKDPGSVFHIATKKNPLGEAVVKYFTGLTNTPPQACDSFSTFPDDNSTMSRNCADWGTMSAMAGTWGRNQTSGARMYHRLALCKPGDGNKYIVAMSRNDYFCEDNVKQASPGDEWKVYVR